jgi:hypothetical protein
MNNLLSIKYWFAVRPSMLLPIYSKIFIGLIIIFVILIFVSGLLQKKKTIYSKIWDRINTFSITNTFVGLIILFFNSEMIPFLSSRFWFVLWGATMAVWLFFVIKDFKKIPGIREQRAKDHEYKKYIP